MDIPFNRWRHDLRAAINTMENTTKLLESGPITDPEIIEALIGSLRKSSKKLEEQYLEVYTMQRTEKTKVKES